MGRPQHELWLLSHALTITRTVGPEHNFPGRGPARTILPIFGGVQVWHPQLNTAGAVHFFTADLRYLLHHPLAQWHVSIQPGPQFTHQARAHEQLMRRNFGISRAFLQCGDKILGPEFHVVRQRNTAKGPEQIYLRTW